MNQKVICSFISIIIGTTILLSLVTHASARSSVRERRDAKDDFNDARREIENEIGIDDACMMDGDCTGNPVIECDHEGEVHGRAIGKCKFTWWFILILVVIAVIIIGAILSCLCSPCCCLYDCMKKLCCCCC